MIDMSRPVVSALERRCPLRTTRLLGGDAGLFSPSLAQVDLATYLAPSTINTLANTQPASFCGQVRAAASRVLAVNLRPARQPTG